MVQRKSFLIFFSFSGVKDKPFSSFCVCVFLDSSSCLGLVSIHQILSRHPVNLEHRIPLSILPPFPSSPHPPQSTYRIWRSEGKDLSAAEAARSMKAISDAAPNRHHPTVGYKASVLHPCHPLTSSPNSQRSLPRWTLSAGGDMDKSEICAKNIFSCLPLACWARRRLWQSTLVRTPVVLPILLPPPVVLWTHRKSCSFHFVEIFGCGVALLMGMDIRKN